MSTAVLSLESCSFSLKEEIMVRASLEATFQALLEQLGPGMDTPDGQAMPLALEAFPGGRWYRDLGERQGHLWGHVQSIKPPVLLEFCGPLFMSEPVLNNVQYRLAKTDGGTRIEFRHSAFGPVPEAFRQRMPTGWNHIHSQLRRRVKK